jgi:hypothetical protein
MPLVAGPNLLLSETVGVVYSTKGCIATAAGSAGSPALTFKSDRDRNNGNAESFLSAL